MDDEEEFKCYCGDWPYTNAHFIVDDIRTHVCADLPLYRELQGKQYCVLHYPHKNKASDFKKVFEERIDAELWDFRMAYFPEVLHFDKKEFTVAADF